MSKICYKPWRASEDSKLVVAQALVIIEEYAEKGLTLTLRQLFYQFVSRDWIQNSQAQYDRLGGIITNARMAGLISWTALEDRTRFVRKNTHWRDPAHIMAACRDSYLRDLWADQPIRPEVWIEKDALVGVIEGVCRKYDVPYFSCRGYTSASEMWGAAQRFNRRLENGQRTVILHLGDHDPSGLDMSWDIWKRLAVFANYNYEEVHQTYSEEEAYAYKQFGSAETDAPVVRRLALNYDQIEEFDPPPNFAKFSDGRIKNYVPLYGQSSWELDALDPETIISLIEDAVLEYRDDNIYANAYTEQEADRAKLAHFVEEATKEDD